MTAATVVVCCYTMDRWADLSAALASVAAQTTAPAETVLVVDHASDLESRARSNFPDVTVVPNAGPAGLSAARNTALGRVRTPVVAFLDDDAHAEPGWLAALITPYADPRVLGVGGRIEPRWDERRPAWFPREFDWVVGCTHAGSRRDAGPFRNPIGANMSFRTTAIREVGGFSNELGRVGTRPVGCEETEACIRLAQGDPDAVFWYAPDAVVRHRVRPERASWGYFRRRCYAEGTSKAAVRRTTGAVLATERSYVTGVLPRAVLRGLAQAARGDRSGLARSGAVVAGLATTVAGYLVGRVGRVSVVP